MRRTSMKTAVFVDKTSNLAALSIKRAYFMDTVRILICAVHGNEAFIYKTKNSNFIYPYSFYINVHIYTIFSIFVKMQIPRYETA